MSRAKVKDRNSTLHKSINSQETAPKRKHVRQLVIETWKANGASNFLRDMFKENVNTNAVCGFKALHVIHVLLHEGPVVTISDFSSSLDFFANLENTWRRGGGKDDKGYAKLIVGYAGFLREKIMFHMSNNYFSGGFSIDEFDKRTNRAPVTEAIIPTILALLELQEKLLSVQAIVFEFEGKSLNECRVSILLPLIVESYALYSICVYLMKKLCYEISSMDCLSRALQQFHSQYPRLRKFFEETGRLQYIISIISVPTLPRDPPDISIPKKSEVNLSYIQKPAKRKAAPLMPQTQKQLNLEEMESIIAQNATRHPIPSMMSGPDTEISRGKKPNDQWEDWAQDNKPTTQGGEQWEDWAQAGNKQSGGEQWEDWANPNKNNNNDGWEDWANPGTNRGGSEGWVSVSGPAQVIVPGGQAIPGVLDGGASSAQEPGFNPINIGDNMYSSGLNTAATSEIEALKKRMSELEATVLTMKSKNQKLILQLKQRDEAIEKWKQGYSELLRSNTNLQSERVTLYKQKEELQNKLEDTVESNLLEKKRFITKEIDDAMASMQKQLYQLGNPTYGGNEKATFDNVSEDADEIARVSNIVATAWVENDFSREAMEIRALSSLLTTLTADCKGSIQLTDDILVKQSMTDSVRSVCDLSERFLQILNKQGVSEADVRAAQDELRQAAAELKKVVMRAANKHAIKDEEAAIAGADLADMASKELEAAARAIEEASRQLLASKAAAAQRTDLHFDQQVSSAIFDSAMAITGATAALIKAANISQQEISKKLGGTAGFTAQWYHQNHTWAEGLISAAKSVAAATSQLVISANGAVTGEQGEEGLIVASKAVAAATTQLVIASRVKSDVMSSAHRGLESASTAVTSATNKLVEAARGFTKMAPIVVRKDSGSSGFVGSKMQEMEQQMLILKLEKQLNAARQGLSEMRKKEYDDSSSYLQRANTVSDIQRKPR